VAIAKTAGGAYIKDFVPPSNRQKVVLVDDDEDIRMVATKRLAAAGYEVLAAADGLEGLALVRAERPHLVLLDLMMPRMHGFTVCQEIRSDPTLNSTRILVSSAKAFPVDKEKARELGADGYLAKPYDLEALVDAVRQTIAAGGDPVLVKFWGTRGSIPTPGPATMRYGGNTACVEVRFGSHIVMLDCGTGAREMGHALVQEFRHRPITVHIFVGHCHWDHIQGFPFFRPAYLANTHITLYSLRGSDKSLEKVFTGQMDGSYFPVRLSELSARLRFVELEEDAHIGEARVSHVYLNHPGVAVGFRVDVGGKSVVYISDHECYIRMNGDNEHNRKLEAELSRFARSADLYIREAQYTEEEYREKRGWGHSTWKDALESAAQAGARRLALFHHDPMHDDGMMDDIMAACQTYKSQHGMQFACFAASDNLHVTL
jgi:phosphoribosyl 1,2-cyclic phosphodiesterase/CheY-like chemotaxis protein